MKKPVVLKFKQLIARELVNLKGGIHVNSTTTCSWECTTMPLAPSCDVIAVGDGTSWSTPVRNCSPTYSVSTGCSAFVEG